MIKYCKRCYSLDVGPKTAVCRACRKEDERLRRLELKDKPPPPVVVIRPRYRRKKTLWE